ncbi:MAG: GDYXXLXY domain-containing protein [Rhizobiaceae bacterium]|nr:GDYXXLXY domain-containing protein [Rhizobiaceae bacterium]
MRRPARIFAIALGLAAVQIGFLGSMILGRAGILREGTEIRLAVEPVDPRDLLRGDYVVLGYPISRIDRSLLAETGDRDLKGRWLYVRLSRDDDGSFAPVAAALDEPPVENRLDNEIDLRGVVVREPGSGETAVQVAYGIERYYVPEGEGRAIEDAMRQDRFEIVAAVDEDGSAQIKALLHDGRAIYREPLF